MTDASRETFDSFRNWKSVQDAIDSDEAEGLYLECKSPASSRINPDMKAKLAKCVSGFANSAGGVLLCGVATTTHKHSGLDLLTQIEPIANVDAFEKSLRLAVVQATTPAVSSFDTRIIKRRKADTRGLVALRISATGGDPHISAKDNIFYFRNGDEFVAAPFEIIRRLFTASMSPDIRPVFSGELVKMKEHGTWTIPLVLQNYSSAFGRDVEYSIVIANPDACERIDAKNGLKDVSSVNPGKVIYMGGLPKGIHRGRPTVAGQLNVKMKTRVKKMRRLDLVISIFADNMQAKYWDVSLTLAKSGFRTVETKSEYLY